MCPDELMEVIDRITQDEDRSRGCLYTQIGDENINLNDDCVEFLKSEYDKEESPTRRKWVLSQLIRNRYSPADDFAFNHTIYDEDNRQIYCETP